MANETWDRRPPAASHAREVEALQVAELYRNLPVGAASSYFGTLLCVAVFLEFGMGGREVVWFAYGTVVAVLRLGLCWLYRGQSGIGGDFTPADWARLAIIGNVLAGIQWGLLGTWIFPDLPGYRQTFSIMVITCFVGGSITAYAPVRWAHPALSLPATIPSSIYIFFFASGPHFMAGFTALFFSAMVLYYAFRETELVAQRLRADVRLRKQLSELEEQVEDMPRESRVLSFPGPGTTPGGATT